MVDIYDYQILIYCIARIPCVILHFWAALEREESYILDRQ